MCTEPDHDEAALAQRVCALLLADLASPPDLEELAREAGTCPYQLSRTFGRIMGKSIPSLLRARRMETAAALLQETDLAVGEIAAQVGYHRMRAFHRAFTREVGMGPIQYREDSQRRA